MHADPICPSCGKRCFRSKDAARAAFRRAAFRFRVYWCDDADAWHVTNSEKR